MLFNSPYSAAPPEGKNMIFDHYISAVEQDFSCKACYLDLILATTISSLQRQTQGSEGQIQPVPG